MGFSDQFSTVPSAGLQTMSLVFGAASLLQGATPFKDSIGTTYGKPLAPNGANLDVINVDATLSEVHSAEVELTSHPVETGADITDHARPKPREIRIDGFVTNAPLDDSLAGATVRALAGLGAGTQSAPAALGITATLNTLQQGSNVVRDAFDKFQLLYQTAPLVMVFTPYRQYQNMVMVSFQANREQQNGDALKFSATFREVFFVSSQTVSVQTQPLAQGALDMGAQSPTPAPAKLIKSKDTQLEQMFGTAFNRVGLTQPPRQ